MTIANVRGIRIKLGFSQLPEDSIDFILDNLSPLTLNVSNEYDYDIECAICGINPQTSCLAINRANETAGKITLEKYASRWHEPEVFSQDTLLQDTILCHFFSDENFKSMWLHSERAKLPVYLMRNFMILLQGVSPVRYRVYVLGQRFGSALQLYREFMGARILWNVTIHALTVLSRGVPLHAAGVVDNKKSAIFLASSGGGKTTATEIIARHKKNIKIVSDDRILLREGIDGLHYISPMPIADYGMLEGDSEDAAPLKAIFFLKKGKSTHVKKLKTLDALPRLMQSIAPSFSGRGRLTNGNIFCLFSRLVDKALAYELSFAKKENFWPECESLIGGR